MSSLCLCSLCLCPRTREINFLRSSIVDIRFDIFQKQCSAYPPLESDCCFDLLFGGIFFCSNRYYHSPPQQHQVAPSENSVRDCVLNLAFEQGNESTIQFDPLEIPIENALCYQYYGLIQGTSSTQVILARSILLFPYAFKRQHQDLSLEKTSS